MSHKTQAGLRDDAEITAHEFADLHAVLDVAFGVVGGDAPELRPLFAGAEARVGRLGGLVDVGEDGLEDGVADRPGIE